MKISGRCISGMQGARRSIKRQKKRFVSLGLPGAAHFFNGTINIDTSPSEYELSSFDYYYKDVVHKSFPRKRVEDFGFIIIDELIHKGNRYQRWGYIYVPFKSPHFNKRNMLEIVGMELDNVGKDDFFDLIVGEGKVKRNK